jgi:RNA polymerase sigma factor (sigma-70 family)
MQQALCQSARRRRQRITAEMNRSGAAMYRVAWYLTGNHRDAERAVLSAVTAVYANRAEYSDIQSRDLFRALARILEVTGSPVITTSPADDDTSADDICLETLDQNRIAAAMTDLTDAEKMVVVLSMIERKQYGEIAEILRADLATIKKWLSRGRRMMRKALQQTDKSMTQGHSHHHLLF